MKYENIAAYREAMIKLASSIEKKVNKILLSKTELSGVKINVNYYHGWFGGDDQTEDKMVMTLFVDNKRVETLTISPYRGVFGKINLMDDFIDNYNKKKNILRDVEILLSKKV